MLAAAIDCVAGSRPAISSQSCLVDWSKAVNSARGSVSLVFAAYGGAGDVCEAPRDAADSVSVSKLTELVRDHTSLDVAESAHLNRLVSEWGMLADFSFSDLLLYVRNAAGVWIVVGQVRPATGKTMYPNDWVTASANASAASKTGSLSSCMSLL